MKRKKNKRRTCVLCKSRIGVEFSVCPICECEVVVIGEGSAEAHMKQVPKLEQCQHRLHALEADWRRDDRDVSQGGGSKAYLTYTGLLIGAVGGLSLVGMNSKVYVWAIPMVLVGLGALAFASWTLYVIHQARQEVEREQEIRRQRQREFNAEPLSARRRGRRRGA